ncbi:SpaH/EbpB family LPXTG-anchored major pilin [Corynebacterium pseudodiphtheriticum]|uniref:SpaH/EbpB family LPXTG-anchored major pilin n=1 Tax=Corynebacterium pseudodiphtheriticum TaxID=37637 RepID=UPI00254FC430|nr:SpaH/EbpB family LPXTG-anchored major pilin [Corynebacterium pseudodiphtheriticum]MDK8708082.1 SpaH/EbpB family LPXTG-anchored major pilin [Corynebacterium pseudodiphtheriticum]
MAKAISKPLALAVAVGLTLGGSFGAGAPAFAQENDVPAANEGLPSGVTPEDLENLVGTTQALPGASLIPADDVFSLTIHKRVNASNPMDATGEVQNASGDPLPGAKFKISKVDGPNIRTQAGLNTLVKLANDYNTGQTDSVTTTADSHEGTTNEDGQLAFNNLAAGAYLVEETATPQGEGNTTYVKSRPFIVLLPMTNAAGTSWNNDVQVYPKNSELSITKKVNDADKHAQNDQRSEESSKITYTLDGLVPQAPEGKELSEFVIHDSYNSDELTLTGIADGNFAPTVELVRDGTATTIDAAAYTINSVAGPATHENGRADDANAGFTVSFDKAGLAAAGLRGGDVVRVTVEATMLNADDQTIENSVNESGIFREPGTQAGEEKFETPNDTVVSYIGDIRVIKEDENNNETKLAGAEFALYRCDSNPENAIQTGTTNEQGELTFKGIHVTDWVNDAAVGSPVEYCLQETKAPDGYVTVRDEPYRINLTRESKEFQGEGRTIRRVSLTVTNLPESERPFLPSTGGMGILIVALLGLGIIAGGVYAARRNSAKA